MLVFLFGCFDVLDNMAAIPDKVTDPDKVIHDYEWFHTAYAQVGARTSQIIATRRDLSAEMDPAEKGRLRIDLGGQQQSCRELVANYNANAAKVTFGSFRGWSLPNVLNPNDCE